MKVSVYRESPVWDAVTRWFHLTAEELRDLHIATYRLACDEDGDPIRKQDQLDWIYNQHPGCVYIY